MYYDDLINLYIKDQVILTGNESMPRSQHITSALKYLHKLNPDMDWTQMTNNEAKLLYGDFLTSDLMDTTKALRSRFILQFFKFLIEEKYNEQMSLDGILKLKPHTKKPFVLDESHILTEKQVISILNYKFKDKPIPLSQKLIIACTYAVRIVINRYFHIFFRKRRIVWCGMVMGDNNPVAKFLQSFDLRFIWGNFAFLSVYGK